MLLRTIRFVAGFSTVWNKGQKEKARYQEGNTGNNDGKGAGTDRRST